jgi:two-component system response regulator GlrR
VLILTAHGTIADAVKALRRGVFGYLAKPFEGAT